MGDNSTGSALITSCGLEDVVEALVLRGPEAGCMRMFPSPITLGTLGSLFVVVAREPSHALYSWVNTSCTVRL